ncbi:hypothetical protein PsAD26_03944 [Pseudovibrio sp. Ad26]|nr:hypothetical protein PsAD26_03944 [Pseudovibrio sp. Ad26]
MRPYLIFWALLLNACTAREPPLPQITMPPPIPADLLRPCPGYRGAIPRNEGQLIDAVVAEKQGRECANGKLHVIAQPKIHP